MVEFAGFSASERPIPRRRLFRSAVFIGILAGCGPGGAVSLNLDSDPPDVREDTQDSAPIEDIGGVEDINLVITPPAGTFRGEVEVTLSAAEGVDLYYTTDGDLPSTRDERYQGPLTFDQSAQLRVLAVDPVGRETYAARSYVRVEGSAADFTSNLPLLVLWTDDDLPSSDDSYTSIAFTVLEPGEDGRTRLVGDAALSVRGGLKIRGSSSSGYPKRSYAFESWGVDQDDDADVPILGMPEGSDWVLYAPLNFDRALMRNALVYGLSNDVGRYAPRTRFVEVFTVPDGDPVGMDDYVGVYVFMERIRRGDGRIEIERLDPEDLEPPEITGGYIFKRDRTGDGESGFTAGTAGGAFTFQQGLVYVTPREEEIPRAQAEYLSDAIDAFADALAAEDHRHPLDGSHYSEHIDVDAWIDHHILNTFPKNPDAFRLSGYFYKDREGPIVAGPVWDFDRSMGCASDSRPTDPTWWDPSNITQDTTYLFEHGWYAGLFEDPAFTGPYWARWAELLQGPLALDAVLARVDAMAAELAEAAPRNFERWRDYPPRGDGTFQAEVDHLKGWIQARHAWISDCLARYPDDPRQCPGE
ncbi:MAG: CotH kinase family protein [Alphaproteobacteria bacterium]|nr:CotH kinase family protein [Alphaproteobacteria bacterium]